MKKLLVIIPVVVFTLFLLNSFALKEDVKDKTRKAVSSGALNIVFRSVDGGQTWKNISEGLPENLQRSGVPVNGSFTNDEGLFLRIGNGLYHSASGSKNSFWKKEIFPGKQRNITSGNNGIFAYDFRGQFLKRANGTSDWSPVYTNFQEQAVRLDPTKDWMYDHFKEKGVCAVFETANGTIFISSNNSIFRSTNGGKIWEQVNAGNGTMRLTESNGVLLATSKEGILRSADNGQNWERVLSEGGVGLAVERIDGGFATLIQNTITQTNRIYISQDAGKTWRAIGEDLQPSWNDLLMKRILGPQHSIAVTSIKQMGKYLICGRTDKIFRSADMGKTWTKLSLPAVENFGFNLSVSRDVMYIMPNKGC